VSESSNPVEGRPTAGRSYGDASTGTRSAQAQQVPQVPAVQPADISGRPAEPAAGAGTFGGGGGHSLAGSGRSFARVGTALSGLAGQVPGRPAPSQARVRKARLRVARVDPWSVMKVSFVLSIAMGIVTIVGTAVVWNVLNALGVFTSLNKTVGDLTSSGTGSTASTFNLASVLSFSHVEGYIMIIALVDVVLVTALATLGSYLYNLAAGFVGGFEVTLAEDQ
jgi:hypothetical protein